MKIEQRKFRGLEWEPQVKQTALLASPIYKGQAQGEEKKHKKRSQNWTSGFSSLQVFWVGSPSCLKDVFSFTCQIKLSCNTDLSVTSNFCCSKTEPRKLHTPLTVTNNFSVKRSESVTCSVVSDSATPWTVTHQAPCLWDSPGKNAGVGSRSLLQGRFTTQGSNLGLLHCRQILYHLRHQGNHNISISMSPILPGRYLY